MSSKHNLYDIMNHSYYLTLTRFINASGYKIARSSVRDSLREIDGVFDYSKLPNLLSSFFSDLMVIEIDSQIDNHEDIITPCLLLKTFENRTYIYVVLNIDKEKVLIFRHDKKDYTITAEEFQNLLRGAVIILKEEETYEPSKKILEAYEKEQDDDKAYINSIKLIDDFLSAKDCQKIIDFNEKNNLFQRSRITSGSSGGMVSDYRTSSTVIMDTQNTMPIVSDLKKKIAVILGCNIDKILTINCVRYHESEEFKPHFDALENDRKTTCLLYLNDDFTGGETYFPEVDFGVTAKTGSLLIFNNRDEKNDLIIQSFHQGSPVLEGKKYACNIWIKS